MGVGKVISKGGDAAMGELSNQATVIDKGAHAHARKSPEAGDKRNVLAAMRAAWNHLRGWLVGILAAIISTLYTVSGPGLLRCCDGNVPSALLPRSRPLQGAGSSITYCETADALPAVLH